MDSVPPLSLRGRVTQVTGTILRAYAPGAKIGELVRLKNPWEDEGILGEVVGFQKNLAIITPLGEMLGLSSTTEVIPTGEIHKVPVGSDMLGRWQGALQDRRLLSGHRRPTECDDA
jgi:type III secretion protein N (ATPase)